MLGFVRVFIYKKVHRYETMYIKSKIHKNYIAAQTHSFPSLSSSQNVSFII